MVSKEENIEKISNVNKEKENLQNKLEELQFIIFFKYD